MFAVIGLSFAVQAYTDIRDDIKLIKQEQTEVRLMYVETLASLNTKMVVVNDHIESISTKLDSQSIDAVYVTKDFVVLKMPAKLNEELVKVQKVK
ncbi:MAG: hypothetical protein ACRC3J_05595 [Culicoidibacterales bacterium]